MQSFLCSIYMPHAVPPSYGDGLIIWNSKVPEIVILYLWKRTVSPFILTISIDFDHGRNVFVNPYPLFLSIISPPLHLGLLHSYPIVTVTQICNSSPYLSIINLGSCYSLVLEWRKFEFYGGCFGCRSSCFGSLWCERHFISYEIRLKAIFTAKIEFVFLY